jgi:hypothetical protein
LFDSPTSETGEFLANLVVAPTVCQDTGPPGGDLVISLRRLLV